MEQVSIVNIIQHKKLVTVDIPFSFSKLHYSLMSYCEIFCSHLKCYNINAKKLVRRSQAATDCVEVVKLKGINNECRQIMSVRATARLFVVVVYVGVFLLIEVVGMVLCSL